MSKSVPTTSFAARRTVRGTAVEVDTRGNVTHVATGDKIGRVVPVVAESGLYARDRYQETHPKTDEPLAWKVTSFAVAGSTAKSAAMRAGQGEERTYLSQRTAIMAMLVRTYGGFAEAKRAKRVAPKATPKTTAPEAIAAEGVNAA